MCVAYLDDTPTYDTIRYYKRPKVYDDRGEFLFRSLPRKLANVFDITGLFYT